MGEVSGAMWSICGGTDPVFSPVILRGAKEVSAKE